MIRAVSGMEEELRQRLLRMLAEDRRVRDALAADGSLYEGYHPDMQAVHEANAAELDRMLGGGWPGHTRAGEDGARAAWVVAQHAIGLPSFQRRCRQHLEEAVARGEAPAWQEAMLLDRIRMLEGRPQLYGTQFDWDAQGRMSPLPIDDPANVDDRRLSVGLEPLAQATERHRRAAEAAGERPPLDFEARQRQFAEWARRIGWRGDC